MTTAAYPDRMIRYAQQGDRRSNRVTGLQDQKTDDVLYHEHGSRTVGAGRRQRRWVTGTFACLRT